MKLSKISVSILFLALLAPRLYPQGAIFLMIYPGARAVGMGGAFTAIADDGLATYYNPAGLGFQKTTNFSFTHSDWLPGLLPGMKYQYTTLTLPFYQMNYGLFSAYLNTGETEVIDKTGKIIGRYSSYDWAMGISFGKKVSPIFGIGGSFKYIYSFLFPAWLEEVMPELGLEGGTGKSAALDIGALLSLPFHGEFRFGLVLQNIGPGIKYTPKEDKDPLPFAFKFGLAHKITMSDIIAVESGNGIINYFLKSSRLVLSYDFHRLLVGRVPVFHSFGFEVSLAPLTFRMGRFSDRDGGRVGRTVGFGIELKYLNFNVANDADIYAFPTENLRYELSFSIPLKLGS